MTIDYSTVTELAGDEISQEQLERLCHRYLWAGVYCSGKDVIEAACGTGPGIGYLAGIARSVRAGDYTENILQKAKNHYSNRVDLRQFDAQAMPYEDHCADVVLLFEAIYYLPSVDKFIAECKRVLRPGGQVLIATANKDLYDFNPSPYSHTYYGVVELYQLFSKHGCSAECFGYLSVAEVSVRQKLLRPVKKFATSFHLIPNTMAAKKLLKRAVFGSLTPMPNEVKEEMIKYRPPISLDLSQPDRKHKVIYCVASLPS
jgi:ubiquinone/menaquinone biosynthesis C-methylase UbiE